MTRAAIAALVCTAVVLTGCATPGPRSSAGVVTTEASVDAFQLVVGDCTGPMKEGDVSSLKVVPCGDPHNYEAFAASDLPDGEFPGDNEVRNKAQGFCSPKFRTFIGVSTKDSAYDLFYLYPTDGTWATGDRQVLCLAGLDKGGIKGTLKGVGK